MELKRFKHFINESTKIDKSYIEKQIRYIDKDIERLEDEIEKRPTVPAKDHPNHKKIKDLKKQKKDYKKQLNENDNLDRSVKGASRYGIDTGFKNYAVVGFMSGGFGSNGIEIFPFTNKQKAEQMVLDVMEVPELFDLKKDDDAYYKDFEDGRTGVYMVGEVGKDASFYFGRGYQYNKPVNSRFNDVLYYVIEMDEDYSTVRFFENEQDREKYIEIDLKDINDVHEDQIKKGKIEFKLS